jgi:hypothetical protein
MRGRAMILTAIAVVLLPATASAQRSAAVFDFELRDTSGADPLKAPDAEHRSRMTQASERLRARLAESGRFKVVDIAPVIQESHASNLQACGGCDVTFADRIGAELSVTGTVYKVSNLILNMMIFVRDAKTGDNVVVMQAEMRGDTDDSWLRAVDWLVRNRLLAGAGAAR